MQFELKHPIIVEYKLRGEFPVGQSVSIQFRGNDMYDEIPGECRPVFKLCTQTDSHGFWVTIEELQKYIKATQNEK